MKLKITQLFDHKFITVGSGFFLDGWFCINESQTNNLICFAELNSLRFYNNKPDDIDGTATKDILKIGDLDMCL